MGVTPFAVPRHNKGGQAIRSIFLTRPHNGGIGLKRMPLLSFTPSYGNLTDEQIFQTLHKATLSNKGNKKRRPKQTDVIHYK